MAPSPVLPKLVGQRVKRREDPRLIQGLGTYVDDIKLVGMQHLAFKRCDIAHGRITSLDTSAAEVMDGVEAVFSGAQIAEFLAPMPIGTPFPSPDHRAVANDVVRYVGEPVAVVVARDRYVARDAADAIFWRCSRIIIDIQFGHLDSTLILAGDLFQRRCNHLARSAPFGPIVYQHGRI